MQFSDMATTKEAQEVVNATHAAMDPPHFSNTTSSSDPDKTDASSSKIAGDDMKDLFDIYKMKEAEVTRLTSSLNDSLQQIANLSDFITSLQSENANIKIKMNELREWNAALLASKQQCVDNKHLRKEEELRQDSTSEPRESTSAQEYTSQVVKGPSDVRPSVLPWLV
ncbi:hypothetical protein GUITHDRAFT_139234 [Guillardia theta CCMP2712]|uniref:Uncharacterized protein n=1 Tax=Guillardia theta (strain CCMP2712) TaxID=905079 RepID=L1JA24_GUITC|nr:hypothetical protein GUITHDRAFT_139234 [Guillardia theta CCMP2712]EKX44940.1 hypothetical protein GUITHDRAFT_139234 [Guillardia theta CCMP2712]|eukprot:XP_005831920.1 hypothetical protein GUITHDRAFT_139234 [Guillardia theta CCMP2712]